MRTYTSLNPAQFDLVAMHLLHAKLETALAVYILLQGASFTHITGLYELYDKDIAEKYGIEHEVFIRALEVLVEAEVIDWDRPEKVVYVYGHWIHQKGEGKGKTEIPRTANSLKCATSQINGLDRSRLARDFADDHNYDFPSDATLNKLSLKPSRKGLGKGSEKGSTKDSGNGSTGTSKGSTEGSLLDQDQDLKYNLTPTPSKRAKVQPIQTPTNQIPECFLDENGSI